MESREAVGEGSFHRQCVVVVESRGWAADAKMENGGEVSESNGGRVTRWMHLRWFDVSRLVSWNIDEALEVLPPNHFSVGAVESEQI